MEDEGYNGDFDAEFGRLVDSRSKASASSLRGWGRGQSIHDRSMGEEISRRRQNLDDRNNFFSRKSFHDMGCSDYMIEALRNQHFVRPSHIQVDKLLYFQLYCSDSSEMLMGAYWILQK